MTVTTDVRYVLLAGNGLATEFSFSFRVKDENHLVVKRIDASDEAMLLDRAVYEVELLETGGIVRYPLSGPALPTGERLLIERVLPLTQTTDLTNQGAFFAETHEDVFDRTVMMIQQVSDASDGSVKLPAGEEGTEIPPATVRADKVLSFDGDGKPEARLGVETIETLAAISGDVTELAASIDHIAEDADTAIAAALNATQQREAAEVAAQSSGITQWYQTNAEMQAALGLHSDGDVVGVFEDETQGYRASSYRRESGSWVFKLILFAGTRKLYVARNGGSDGNDGLTDQTPIQTINRLLQILRNGDHVLFRRGDEWECHADAELNIEDYADVTLDAYGNGPDPRISGKQRLTSFTQESGNVYRAAVSLPAQQVSGARNYALLFEDFKPCQEVTLGSSDDDVLPASSSLADIIAFLENNPGWFYFDGGTISGGWPAGTHTYYFHPKDSSQPGNDGKVYQAFATDRSVRLGTNCVCRNLLIDHGFHHDGLTASGNSYWENNTCLNPARHHCVLQAGRLVNCVHMHMNPRRAGSFFHTNPSSYQPGDTQHGCRGCIAFGDPELETPIGTAYFCHGAPAPIVDEMIYVDCEAYNVGQVYGQTDINKLRAIRTTAKNFTHFYSGVALDEVHLDGLVAIGGTNRWATLSNENARLFISEAYIDTISENIFFSTNGSADVDIRRSLIVHNPARRDGGSAQLFSLASSLGSRPHQGKITIRDSYYINPTHSNENFFRLPAPPLDGYDINNFVVGVPGHRHLEIDEGADKTSFEDHHAFNKDSVYRVKAASIIGSHQPGQKLQLRHGVIAPRDLIAVDCAYSQDGANPPRSTVMVGDRIWDLAANNSLAESVATPSVRLQSVCFADTSNGAHYIAVGPFGTIWSTGANNAQIWTKRTTPNDTAMLKAVALDVSGIALAVGDSGVIWRSDDDGASWTEISSAVTVDLTSVDTDGVNFLIGTKSRSLLQVPVGSTSVVELPNQATNGEEARIIFNDSLNDLWILGETGGGLRTSPNGGVPTFTNRPQPHEADWAGFARSTDRIVGILNDDHSSNSVQISVSKNGLDWDVEPTILPFRPTGIAGPGASTFGGRGLVVVGESGMRADSWDGRNWSINPIDAYQSNRYAASGYGDAHARVHQL